MESQDTENRTDDSPIDPNMEIVKNVNKYLRKALKKIDELLLSCAPPEGENKLHEVCDDSQVTLKKRKHKSNDKSGESSSKKIHFENGQLDTDSDVRNSQVCDTSIVRTEPESHDEANDNADEDTIEISSDGSNLGESYQPPVCHPVKINQPVIVSKFDESTTSISMNIVYKAFLANLPVMATVPKLEEWLWSKGVINHEDIIIFTKQTFKTSIISYFDKKSRDHLLSLDGQLFEGVPIKIRIFVDQFTPAVDKK